MPVVLYFTAQRRGADGLHEDFQVQFDSMDESEFFNWESAKWRGLYDTFQHVSQPRLSTFYELNTDEALEALTSWSEVYAKVSKMNFIKGACSAAVDYNLPRLVRNCMESQEVHEVRFVANVNGKQEQVGEGYFKQMLSTELYLWYEEERAHVANPIKG